MGQLREAKSIEKQMSEVIKELQSEKSYHILCLEVVDRKLKKLLELDQSLRKEYGV